MKTLTNLSLKKLSRKNLQLITGKGTSTTLEEYNGNGGGTNNGGGTGNIICVKIHPNIDSCSEPPQE